MRQRHCCIIAQKYGDPSHAQVDGLHLRVDMATGAAGTAAAKTYSRGRSIFVGNLHFTAQVFQFLETQIIP